LSTKRILSIGQCFADHSAIARAFSRYFGAEVEVAASATEARAMLREKAFDLVLVNRILDRDASSGLELIGQLKADEALRDLPVMLVSNYEEAQQEAIAQGALPGFGKASLGEPAMLGQVKAVLG
jgi:two-component system chemotaxis response regulator CheY